MKYMFKEHLRSLGSLAGRERKDAAAVAQLTSLKPTLNSLLTVLREYPLDSLEYDEAIDMVRASMALNTLIDFEPHSLQQLSKRVEYITSSSIVLEFLSSYLFDPSSIENPDDLIAGLQSVLQQVELRRLVDQPLLQRVDLWNRWETASQQIPEILKSEMKAGQSDNDSSYRQRQLNVITERWNTWKDEIGQFLDVSAPTQELKSRVLWAASAMIDAFGESNMEIITTLKAVRRLAQN